MVKKTGSGVTLSVYQSKDNKDWVEDADLVVELWVNMFVGSPRD